jgi:hypothetical protein
MLFRKVVERPFGILPVQIRLVLLVRDFVPFREPCAILGA